MSDTIAFTEHPSYGSFNRHRFSPFTLDFGFVSYMPLEPRDGKPSLPYKPQQGLILIATNSR